MATHNLRSGFRALATCLLTLALVSCAGLADTEETDTVSARASAWVCLENESAFGELNVGCVNSAEYIEGATVAMTFTMFCSPKPENSENVVISRFRGKDFSGNFVGWLSRAEASFDGGPKEDLELSPTSDAFLLDRKQYGIDPLASGNTLDTVHARVLPTTKTLLIRATIEPERVTTTSLFTWGDWQEPISYLAERGCVWR